ncbi:hypothetical protein OUZ56_022709 [Daphnia magna]|uniref:Uncharacterized protein n=1 Tax=Daphnia magna TaxID=35525 RepID=A0ABR0AX85_9CRUS|nr:hypothetical protein OUZ56_022709 [Daphnia magna]
MHISRRSVGSARGLFIERERDASENAQLRRDHAHRSIFKCVMLCDTAAHRVMLEWGELNCAPGSVRLRLTVRIVAAAQGSTRGACITVTYAEPLMKAIEMHSFLYGPTH